MNLLVKHTGAIPALFTVDIITMPSLLYKEDIPTVSSLYVHATQQPFQNIIYLLRSILLS